MNKFIFTLLLIFACVSFTSAQDDEKIKGDRNVTIKQTYIDPFNKIIVGEDFSVEIIYNSKPSVEIETDENLHQYIEFGVNAGVLTFKTTKKITSSKKMNIKVNYGDGLESIETLEDGEIRSLTSLELANTNLKTSGSSKAYLNIRTAKFDYTSSDKARSKLNVDATTSTLVLGDNCKVEALLNTKTAKIDLYQKANLNIEGVAEDIHVRGDLSSSFNGKEFAANNCNLVVEGNSSATVRVKTDLIVELSGGSEVYLYGSPKITLNKFLGSSKLQKKEN
ncbi:MAG: GIN domain-containing protein [Aquaticitalea sp.]